MNAMLSLVFAAVFALTATTPAAAQRDGNREEERVERTLTLEPGGTVRLKTFSGRVTITGTTGNQVVIKAVRRATRDRLNDIKLEIAQSGSTIDIDANHRLVERRNDNVVETTFDIQVPSSTTLDVKTFSAPVSVTGVTGAHTVEGFSSDLRLVDVSGGLRAKTFSGGITLEARNWAEGEDLNLDTFSGSVTLRLPDSARGSVSFNSFSGSFTSDLPVAITSSSRRNFRGELNGGGAADFRLKTFSGDVSIRK